MIIISNINILQIKKKSLKNLFMKKGIKIGLISGICYGLYTAFISLAMTKGVWKEWYGGDSYLNLSMFVMTYILASLGNALNDICSAVWAVGNLFFEGKVLDFFRCLKSKPGKNIVIAALIGGPIAGTAFVVALQLAGSVIVPISALCPAIASIFGKVFYNQSLGKRSLLGISICIFSSFIIGSSSINNSLSKNIFLGVMIALIAAIGWGFEGCVAGYASVMVDPKIGICIRQLFSGIINLFIVLPLLGLISGHINLIPILLNDSIFDYSSIGWFMISGLFTFLSFMLWYTGNSMCGAGLGAACNGTYSFWGPLFCFIILGLIEKIPGWNLSIVSWIGAVMMVIGILLITVNPLDFFKRRRD